MNVRMQLYKKHRLAGMSAYRAAITAGYAHNTAIHASKNLEKRRSFKDFLTQNGIDDDKIVEVLKDGLNATKKVSIYYEKDAEGESKETGYEVDEVPDHPTRHKFLDTALELRGDKKPAGEKGGFTNNGIIYVKMETIKINGQPLEFDIGG